MYTVFKIHINISKRQYIFWCLDIKNTKPTSYKDYGFCPQKMKNLFFFFFSV